MQPTPSPLDPVRTSRAARLGRLGAPGLLVLALLAPAAPAAAAITEFAVPTAGSFPFGITAGPDGHLWFTEGSGNRPRASPSSAVRRSSTASTSPRTWCPASAPAPGWRAA